MLYWQSRVYHQVVKVLWPVGIVSTAFCIAPLVARAQVGLPDAPGEKWVSGPTVVNLGKVAQLHIPDASWRFGDGEVAQEFLRKAGNLVPRGLLGIMRSAADWTLVFEFQDSGYVKEPPLGQLNADALLKAFQEHFRREHPQAGAARWNLAWKADPQYNSEDHLAEWALQIDTTSGASTESQLNYAVHLLGRRGILKVTTIYRGMTDVDGFHRLVKGVSFREGERYQDFRAGDKQSAVQLTDILARESEKELLAETADGSATGTILLWAGLGVLVVAGVVALVVLGRMRGGQTERTAAPAVAHAAVAAGGTTGPVPTANRMAPSAPKGGTEPKRQPATARKSLNNHRSARRKKAFDYNRYFTDLISTVSSHGMLSETAGGPEGDRYLPAMPAANSAPAEASNGGPTNEDLIAHQTALIEEQGRLIQEQTRLIEEKTKLIAEKNQLLKLQSELIDNKLL
jgi:uncharacterized membrane-anchored protein